MAFLSSTQLFPAQNNQDPDSPKLEEDYSRIFKEAEKLRRDGEFEKSIELLEKSLITATEKEVECEALLKLGLLYWNLGEPKESSEKYRQALALALKLDLRSVQEECHNALQIYKLYNNGKSSRSSGEHQKSIDFFQRAIDLARKTGSKEHELKCLRQMSATYWRLNDLQKFFFLNDKALKIARSLNHRAEEGKCLNNIGIFYKKIDNYSKALTCYEEALKIAQIIKDKKEESSCLNNIGIIYKNIGNYDKALDYLERSLAIDRNTMDDIYISMTLNNMGTAYRNKGLISGNTEDFQQALDYFNECLTLTQKTGDKKTEIHALNNIGNVYSDLKKYHDALRSFQTGYEKAKKVQDVEAMGMILNNMGIVHYNQGNYKESTMYYQKAIDLAREIKGGQILWEAYLEIAKAYEKQSKLTEALENYKNSISIIEDIRSQFKLEELKASYFGSDKRIDAYHNLIHLLMTLHQSNPTKAYHIEAFDYMERAKARAFLDSLEHSQINISQQIDFKLQNQEKELMKDISKLYTKLLAAKYSLEEKQDIKEQLQTCEDRWETLKREVRTKSPVYANLKYPEIITFEEAQKKLPDTHTAFFAYSIGKDSSYVFVVTKKGLKIFSLPPRDKINTQVSNYLKLIADREHQDFTSGFELYCQFVQPGLDEDIENIIFIPDGILHFLPFEALVTTNPEKHWLIEDYEVSYIPSISSLREIIQRKKSNGTKPGRHILAFGDPFFGSLESKTTDSDIIQSFYSSSAFNLYRLKYSGFEIDKIGSLFKRKKRDIFRRKEASEEQLKGHNLADYKIIHFATHSLIDDKKPARSAIVLSLDEDPAEDGFLQMREIYNLNLNSDLVTLSSCQTGLGQFIHGEGIDSLNRAFFYAGASSVLMSLWSVNDQASAQLMERFYLHLRSSQSIMSALRKAKLEMIGAKSVSHPYYWAGFVISGKADEVVFIESKLRWFVLGMALLLVGVVVYAALISLQRKAKITP